MINNFNAIPYHWAQLLHVGLNVEVKVTYYQNHFYGCQNYNRAVRKYYCVDISGHLLSSLLKINKNTTKL